jgi:hypothetical protein
MKHPLCGSPWDPQSGHEVGGYVADFTLTFRGYEKGYQQIYQQELNGAIKAPNENH